MLTFNHKVIKIGSGRVWISNTYIPPMTLRCVFTQAPSSNTNCGSGTTTGAAELARIPASWGGLG